ncbi:MAG: putative small protein [Pseudomonadota bacterium]|jgi:hypothetical protein
MNQPVSNPSHMAERSIGSLPDHVVQALAKAVSDLRYGLVQLTVHDGKVVQLDVTERQRF